MGLFGRILIHGFGPALLAEEDDFIFCCLGWVDAFCHDKAVALMGAAVPDRLVTPKDLEHHGAGETFMPGELIDAGIGYFFPHEIHERGNLGEGLELGHEAFLAGGSDLGGWLFSRLRIYGLNVGPLSDQEGGSQANRYAKSN